MPVIVREISDDEAVIAMVDANLQREHILPSEKAFAYKMKLEQYKFKREDIRKYFPKSYTDRQVCDTIIKLLEQWQRKRERDRDAR